MAYHLIVSADRNAFANNQFEMPAERCLEYTSNLLSEYYFRFGESRLDELIALPALIAHEDGVSDQNVQLVRLTEIMRRNNRVRALFEPTGTEISYEEFRQKSFELDIEGFEYNRTHWALKNVDLLQTLARSGINAAATFPERPYVDLETHAFLVALSFPGEDRDLVQDIASRLEQRLGLNSVFYDFHYQAFLARPNLDTLLQTIYRNAMLNVVFLSSHYERKHWCSGIEFRAIREIIRNRENNRVMFIRTGEGEVQGVFDTDGWVDARSYSRDTLAYFVEQRARVFLV